MSSIGVELRGSEPVGLVDDLPAVRRLLVLGLRNWLEGPEAQAEVWNAFALGLGASAGRSALRAFEVYIGALAAASARRLCRHAPACLCVGRDEADIAAAVTLAARGDRAAAADCLARLVRAETVPAVLDAAAVLGAALEGFGSGCGQRLRRGEFGGPNGAGFRTLH